MLYGDKVYMFHRGSNVAKKMDAWTDAYKENNVYNIYMKPRGNKTDAMPLSESSGGLPAGSEPVRPENPDPEDPGGGAPDPEVPEAAGGAHVPMRDGVDGEQAMVARVPHLPPGPSARQIAEHKLTGHEVYRSWCRHCVASEGRAHAHCSREEGELQEIGIDYGFFGRGGEEVLPILCVKCRNSSTGGLGATVVDRKGASDCASSFLTAFVKSLGFKRILVRSDNERPLSSLIERVTCNLTAVELVLMTFPEGDHAVREINAQTRILGSQLEQRLGSRIDDVVDTTSWSELCFQIQTDGRWSYE